MSVFFGTQEAKDFYLGSSEVNSIYLGNTLVWERKGSYDVGEIVFESSTGGLSKNIDIICSGKFRVIMVGAGGGSGSLGYWSSNTQKAGSAASGGSGGLFDGIVQLEKGSYLIRIGAYGTGVARSYSSNSGQNKNISRSSGVDTRIDSNSDSTKYMSVSGGGGGGISNGSTLYYGTRGSYGVQNVTVISINTKTNGNVGSTSKATSSSTSGRPVAYGGAAVDSLHGAGGDAQPGWGGTKGYARNGGAGYIKIIYEGE